MVPVNNSRLCRISLGEDEVPKVNVAMHYPFVVGSRKMPHALCHALCVVRIMVSTNIVIYQDIYVFGNSKMFCVVKQLKRVCPRSSVIKINAPSSAIIKPKWTEVCIVEDFDSIAIQFDATSRPIRER